MAAYRAFLEKIGYLVPPPADVQATTANVDAELALQAGPQLVVPILNARYALNAANARWGSLYDALYGTDAIPETDGADKGTGYNPVRGAKVIAYARALPRPGGAARKAARTPTPPATASKAASWWSRCRAAATRRSPDRRSSSATRATRRRRRRCCCAHNGLHLDIQIDRSTPIGTGDAAGVSDVVLEAALSTILDLEDSVAVVDAEDKVLAYRNWLGILQGTLTEQVSKGGKTLHARPEPGPRVHRRRTAARCGCTAAR